jgi:hypothetical protein
MTERSSIRTGLVKPNRSMLAAIWRICLREWVRAFRRAGFRAPGDRCSI